MPLLTKGFRTKTSRADHFKKHRHECGGAKNEVEYEKKSDRFMAGPVGPTVSQCVRPGGDVVRYDASTGEFGCLSPDGYIRTYKIFANLTNGLAYYMRQCARTYP